MPIINSEVRSSNLKIAVGMHTTVAADDLLFTGLQKVLYAVAQLDDAPVQTMDRVVAFVGNQAGTPPAGNIRIRSYMPTSVSSTLPAAATTFAKKVSWIAVGT